LDASQIQGLSEEHRGKLASADDADFDWTGRLGAVGEKRVQIPIVSECNYNEANTTVL